MSITRLAVGSLKAHAATANRYPRQTCSHYPDSPLSGRDRKSTRLNSSHSSITYAVFCLKKSNRATEGGLHGGPRVDLGRSRPRREELFSSSSLCGSRLGSIQDARVQIRHR